MSTDKKTDIAELGEFGLIDRLGAKFEMQQNSTIKGIGDDAAVIDAGDYYMLVSSELLLEGIAFNLVYTPMQHLGYKAVTAAVADIYAMNGTPQQLTLSLGVSARFSVEDIDALYEGVRLGCKFYGIDLVGGDTTSSMTGLSIGVTCVGRVDKDKICYRSGAQVNDVICITGDLGAAYMGLQLLERESRALKDVANPQPQFSGYDYLLRRQLRPEIPPHLSKLLADAGVQPTSMIDLSDGLASDLLQICRASGVGAKIFLERLPIASETFKMADELHTDPVISAMNGGEDYEMMFTVKLEDREKILGIGGIEQIGYVVSSDRGVKLTTPDGEMIDITAQGFR